MNRVAIYARYSSDSQRDASIEDQIRVCRQRAEREGWTIVNCYTDHAISGASLIRPGVQMLIQDGLSGKLDIVLCEDLDRLSRDQEDIAGIYKRMEFAGVKIFTLSDGIVTDLHVGLKGTMNARYLKDLAAKTHRGLRGRVEAGKSGGGNCFGYNVLKRFDAAGEPIRGEREINREEAAVVERIFRDYAAGVSPKAIAHALNREGVSGPSGEGWGPSTIHGNRRRGTGMLNNELYIGRLVWNRLRYVKDPDTGKRVSRENPPSEWLIRDVPEKGIIGDELWQAVKAKQTVLEERAPKFWGKQRGKNLFSFLLKCGECGSGFSKVSQNRYGCSNARNKGICSNRLTVRQDALEQAVLHSLQANLMDPALCEQFCTEYVRHMNELRRTHNAALSRYQAELARLDKDIDRMIKAICDGFANEELKLKFNAADARKKELRKLIGEADEAPPAIHPSMAERYRKEVNRLVAALNDKAHQAEASALIRDLIDRIVLTPNPERNELMIDLHGDLAGILNVAHGRPAKPTVAKGEKAVREAEALETLIVWSKVQMVRSEAGIALDDERKVKMVAGAGFEPAAFRL
jgi:site-specific DNA recombinase